MCRIRIPYKVPVFPKAGREDRKFGHRTPLSPRSLLPGKIGPIIAKFTYFKNKSNVLCSSPKLKGSPISICEDYSARVRMARKKPTCMAKNVTHRSKLVLINSFLIKGLSPTMPRRIL